MRPAPANRGRAPDFAAETLGVVLAGGNGTRLAPLTRDICKPALPFGGVRCIDFTLSNCANSGVRTVGVATQYKPAALHEYLATNWGGATAAGQSLSVDVWRADQRAPRLGYRGTADAVYRNLAPIEESGCRFVLILAGDHVYQMDYRPMLEAHYARGADVTVGSIEVPAAKAHHFGILATDAHGRVRRFVEKPRGRAELGESGATVMASMGIYVFSVDFLARVLTIDAFTPRSTHDFGGDILPALVDVARVHAYPLPGSPGAAPYWRDVGTLEAYWSAHMELLGPTPRFSLHDPRWPIARASVPSLIGPRMRTAAGGSIENSLVAEPNAVAGRVNRCTLFADVDVQPGASLIECVVLPGASIGPGCRLRGAIIDAGHRVPAGTIVECEARALPPVVLSQHCARPELAAPAQLAAS